VGEVFVGGFRAARILAGSAQGAASQ